MRKHKVRCMKSTRYHQSINQSSALSLQWLQSPCVCSRRAPRSPPPPRPVLQHITRYLTFNSPWLLASLEQTCNDWWLTARLITTWSFSLQVFCIIKTSPGLSARQRPGPLGTLLTKLSMRSHRTPYWHWRVAFEGTKCVASFQRWRGGWNRTALPFSTIVNLILVMHRGMQRY